MAFTDHCEIFASISESLINSLVANVARQRPSLFNYGTKSFVDSPQFMCSEIEVSPGLPGNQPHVTLEHPLPVPGADGYAFEWCAQLVKLEIDFHPFNHVHLPPELSPGTQTLALHATLCAAIACPSKKDLQHLGEKEGDKYPVIDPAQAFASESSHQNLSDKEWELFPFNPELLNCFCIELFATAHLITNDTTVGPVLRIELTGLEIVDIKPDGLEQNLECFIATTVSLGILPRLRLAVRDLLFDLNEFGQLSIGLTVPSASVPYNPSIEKDRLSVFVDVNFS
ncbi:hypothetical protein GM415_15575 [Pseudodesulfovibrio cashew]|uniref:Uncharacterized protein n=1 Tax=Pseudodesulfovibrio cashew TaxID=2678688 RepID=A0A6I6JF63_9BACT|nr:hypothetical protein [Pseudodesulfovibrio cashew]QGY41476.1 hypothetical protein GM415_15575 [Pseudodesulfovibrio cashew]